MSKPDLAALTSSLASLIARLEAQPPADGLLTDEQVARLCGTSRRTVWTWTASGDFPAPVSLPGNRLKRWRRDEVDRWIARLPAAKG